MFYVMLHKLVTNTDTDAQKYVGFLKMEETKKVAKKPTSAFALYVQLYCKKRIGKSKFHSTFVEATKSWLTLSSKEKEKIQQKYNDYCQQIRKSYAQSLRNIEPYMKKKKMWPQQDTLEIRNKSLQTENQTIFNSSSTQQDSFQDLHNEEVNETNTSVLAEPQASTTNSWHTPTPSVPQHRVNLIEESHLKNTEDEEQECVDSTYTPLPEPMPPTIRSAKDLFDIVSSLRAETDSNWKSLSSTQKHRYQVATLALKKDYISKYKSYLESLPSKTLFEHYYNKSSEFMCLKSLILLKNLIHSLLVSKLANLWQPSIFIQNGPNSDVKKIFFY